MNAPIHFVRPICAERGGGLNTFFIPGTSAARRTCPMCLPHREQEATVEILESTANDPSLYLDMEFRPGDIQLLKNSVILHKRTAYEDWEEPSGSVTSCGYGSLRPTLTTGRATTARHHAG